jgi:LysM repeat protein
VSNQESLSSRPKADRQVPSRLRPAEERVRLASIPMISGAVASMCMIAALVTDCEYAPQPSGPETARAAPSASPSASSSPTAGAKSLSGSTELNKYFLPVRYTCVEGDTWEAIGREFGLKPEILQKFNPSATLKAGSTIDLRGRDVPQLGAGGSLGSNPDGTATYIVKAEDTLSGITSRFGVPGYALRGANPSLGGNGDDVLRAPGQKLTIPSTR